MENATTVTPSANGNNGLLEFLKPELQKIIMEVNEIKKSSVRNMVKKEVEGALLPKSIEVKQAGLPPIKIENVHQNFETLLYIISKGHNVYLYGDPGSGKSTGAHQCATALGRPFGYISLNPQTPDSRLLGFIDANGVYRETEFRRRYEQGGVFCIDELDNSSPSLLTTLNSALENGGMAFPDKIVSRHPEFVLVATGNTSGEGANRRFPERRPFDCAFAERFSYLEWNYDSALEKNIQRSINNSSRAELWAEWVQKIRAYAKNNYPELIISPRATFKGVDYLKEEILSVEQIADIVIFKGKDDIKNSILNSYPIPKGLTGGSDGKENPVQ